MFYPKYKELCGDLKAPANKIEEVIEMTENRKKKPYKALKIAGVLAAALAVMVMTVSAAAPQIVQPIIQGVMNIISMEKINDYQDQITLDNGMVLTSTFMPSCSVENRDGRAILVVEGVEEVDITEALAADGAYSYEKALTDDMTFRAEVKGSIDSWTIAATTDSEGDTGMTDFTVTYTSEDQKMDLVEDVQGVIDSGDAVIQYKVG